jgi:hypothetical protein
MLRFLFSTDKLLHFVWLSEYGRRKTRKGGVVFMQYTLRQWCVLCLFLMSVLGLSAQRSQIKPAADYKLPTQSATVWDEIRQQILAGKPVGLSELPLLNKIQLSDDIKNFLNQIKIHAPWIEEYPFGIAVRGKINLFGAPITTMLFFAYDDLGHISFYIVIPPLLKFSQILPQLAFLDTLFPQYRIFALSTTDYEFEQFKVKLEPGLNMLTKITIGHPLDKVMNIVGTRMNELEIHGVLNPAITGSSFTAILPGSLKIGGPGLTGKFTGLETTGLKLRVAIEEAAPEVRVPTLSIVTGFQFVWPEVLPAPQLFEGAIKITPTKGEIWGRTSGKLDLPSLPGAHVRLRDVRLTAEVDWAQLAGSSGTIPLSGLGFQTFVELNPHDPESKKAFETAVKVAVTSVGGLGDFVLVGKMDGNLGLEEILDFGSLQVLEASKLVGQAVDLKPLYKEKVPRLEIEDPHLEIIPKTVDLAGKLYEQKIAIGTKIALLNTVGVLEFSLSKQGIRALGYLSNLEIGPLKITGFLPEDKGARIDFRLDLLQQYFHVSGRLHLDILGGISSETLIVLEPRGLVLTSTTKLFEKFEANLEILADLLNNLSPDNFYVKGHMKQDLMEYIEREMKTFARMIVPKYDADAQKEFDRVQAEIATREREKEEEYKKCMGPDWNWSHARCTLFWGEIVKRNFELGGLYFYRDALLKPGVPLARGIVSAFADVTSFAAEVLAKGINIKSFEFDGKLSELVREGKLVKVSMRIVFLGREVELKDMQFNFNDIPGSVGHIFSQLQKLFGDGQTSGTVENPALTPSGRVPGLPAGKIKIA